MLLLQVDVQFVRMMERFIPLAELKKYHHEHKSKGGPLKHMALFTRARLSVQPLTKGLCGWDCRLYPWESSASLMGLKQAFYIHFGRVGITSETPSEKNMHSFIYV